MRLSLVHFLLTISTLLPNMPSWLQPEADSSTSILPGCLEKDCVIQFHIMEHITPEGDDGCLVNCSITSLCNGCSVFSGFVGERCEVLKFLRDFMLEQQIQLPSTHLISICSSSIARNIGHHPMDYTGSLLRGPYEMVGKALVNLLNF